MAGLDEYSTTASSNGTINSIDIAEGCQPSGINNAIRQLMADLRRFANDIGAKAVASGTDTVTLTTETGLTAYADGTILAFIAGGTNTGAATLNVDSVGAKAIRKTGDVALAANDITAGKLCIVAYDASANSAAGAWLLANPNPPDVSTLQPLDADLTAIAALTTTSYGRALLELADAAALFALISSLTNAAYEALGKARGSSTKTDDYTLALTDAGKTVIMDADEKEITIPANGSVAFPTDTYINIALIEDGNLYVAADTGVTLNGVSAGYATIATDSNRYGGALIQKVGTDAWIIPNQTVEV